MLSTPSLSLAFMLVLARGTFAQDAAAPGSNVAETTTPKPIDWIAFLKHSIFNWKMINGYYGIITIELQKRGYPLEIIKPYSQDALGVAEKCLEENLANYSSPELTTAIKKYWKDALALYPNDDWNVTLVDNVVAEFEKFYPEDAETSSNDRAYKVVLGLTNSMKVLICWRTYLEKSMKNPENNGDDGLLYDCANRIYQGFIRGFYGPCTDGSTTAASIDDSTPPYVGFWTICLEGCAEKFESNKA